MPSLNFQDILYIVIELVIVVFSIMVHEISHGFVAYKFGDTTAKDAGRLTLNPVKHLDPFGSIILPLIMSLMAGPIFAYAKPVPYNPYRLKNRKWGELAVALAGPASNFLLALFGAGVCWLIYLYLPNISRSSLQLISVLYYFGYYFCIINLVLMFFNLIPLPPLDGATIITIFLNEKGMEIFYKVKQYSMFILLILLFVIPMILPFDPLGWYLQNTAYRICSLLMP